MSRKLTKFILSFGTLICLSSFLTPPSRSQSSPSETCLNKITSTQSIDEAIKDASNPTACEKWNNLEPIIKTNPRLIWKDDQVLMVTWKPACPPDPPKPKPISCFDKRGDEYHLDSVLWVTAVPEVKSFILIQDYYRKQNHKSDNISDFLRHRLEQYLGLKPNSNYERFIEIWVNPSDLERACIDKEINDGTCNMPNPKDDSKSEYPFTGLGYTYDWGNSNTDVGASEFIIKKGAKVTIENNKSIEEYSRGLIN